MHASSLPRTDARSEPADPRSRPRIAERTLARAQAASGLAFALFLGLHLANNLLAPLGLASYAAVQGVLRVYYQFPLVEVVLVVGAAIVHVTCGVLRARARRRRGQVIRDAGVRRHRRLGWALAVIVVLHFLATRGIGLLFGVEVGFGAVAFSLADTPAFFYPYYLFFGAAAAYHGGIGAVRAARSLGLRAALPGRRAGILFAVYVVLLAVALLAFGGRLFPVGDPLSSDYARVYTERLR
jgi:succinate dehydrogenase/fumarate reductase cytochrome b subunit